MKNYLFTLLALAVLGSCQTLSNKKEVQEVLITYASYGAEITSGGASDIMELNELMQDHDSLEIKITGSIKKTCKTKGCWMTVNAGDSSTIRVTFQEYGFFVPKEGMADKTAIFEGRAFKSVTSVEMLRHFAQDEGKSTEEINAITSPKEEYTFVATGVLIEEESKTTEK